MNPFMGMFLPIQSGLQDVAPPPTAQSAPPGTGLTVSQGPVDPAQQARMDQDEAEGASNLRLAWERHDALRAQTDAIIRRFQAGQASAEEAAAAVERYEAFKAANRAMLEPRYVNRGNPIWNFFFGGARQ